MPRNPKSGVKLGIFSLVFCISVANAVNVEVSGTKNWIWFDNGDGKPTQTNAGGNEEVKEENGKVKLTGPVHYYKPPTHFIDSITLDGSSNKAVIQTNKSFGIGTLTLKGETSIAKAIMNVQVGM